MNLFSFDDSYFLCGNSPFMQWKTQHPQEYDQCFGSSSFSLLEQGGIYYLSQIALKKKMESERERKKELMRLFSLPQHYVQDAYGFPPVQTKPVESNRVKVSMEQSEDVVIQPQKREPKVQKRPIKSVVGVDMGEISGINPGVSFVEYFKPHTCHQCKIRRDTVALCSICYMKKVGTYHSPKRFRGKMRGVYCNLCLFNRYRWKFEEVKQLEAQGRWECPKCRGFCNCAACRKQKAGVDAGTKSAPFRANFLETPLHRKNDQPVTQGYLNRINKGESDDYDEGGISDGSGNEIVPDDAEEDLNEN